MNKNVKRCSLFAVPLLIAAFNATIPTMTAATENVPTTVDEESVPAHLNNSGSAWSHQIRAAIGTRSAVGLDVWAAIPSSMITSLVSIDFARYYRFQTDFSLGPFDIQGWRCRASLGGGASVHVYDSTTKGGSTEIIIPVLIDIGILAGRFDRILFGRDGTDEDSSIHWFIVGPSTGVDLTFWGSGRLGFDISLKLGYMFSASHLRRVRNVNEGGLRDAVGYFETVLALGLASK